MKTLISMGIFLLCVLAFPVYAQELPPPIATSPKVDTSSVEWIKSRISYYANLYGVSADVMNAIVKAESGYNCSATHITSKEHSVGLVQINLLAHNIDEYDARAPNFALDFLAKNLKNGNCRMWTTCPLGTSPVEVN